MKTLGFSARWRTRSAGVMAASVLVAGLALVVGTGVGAGAATATQLTVGYIPATTAGGIPAIGDKFGWFKKEGLDIKWAPFTSGPAQAAAMAGGSLDISYLGGPAIWTSVKGIGKIVGLSDLSYDIFLLARPDSGIKSVRDLKGQRVGFSQGNASHMFLLMSLESAGMSFSDVKTTAMDPPTAVSAFLSGAVPAVSVFAPFAGTILEKEPGTVVLKQSRNFANTPLPGVLVASDKLLEENPGALKKFLRVAVKATEYRARHRSDTVNAVARFAKVPRGPLFKQYDLEYWIRPAAILRSYQTGRFVAWVRKMQELQVRMGVLSEIQPASTFMRLGLHTAALKEYLAAQKKPK